LRQIFNAQKLALCIAISAMLCGLSVPCAHAADTQDPADYRQTADDLLSGIFDSYKNYTRIQFEDLVADDFAPSQSDFINNVESGFYSGNILEITYFINKVLPAGNKLSVSFSWQKKTVPRAGSAPLLTKGKAEFVFKKQGDKWLLVQAGGDDPF